VRYGTMKDNVLSLKVVLANGELMTTARRAKKSSPAMTSRADRCSEARSASSPS